MLTKTKAGISLFRRKSRDSLDKTKQVNAKQQDGFSLVEIIVVVAIMAVLVTVLAPSLLNYIERSRAKKDMSATDEIVHALQVSLSDPEVYKEVRALNTHNNVACYIDKSIEAGYEEYRQSSGADTPNGYYEFDENTRIDDEIVYHGAGNMTGVTLTFKPETQKSGDGDTEFVIKNAQVNKFSGSDKQMGDTLPKLTGKMTALLSEQMERDSATYKNSDFTVFIRTSTPPGSDEEKLDIYGQYNGTNLPEISLNAPITDDRDTVVVPDKPDPGPGGGGGIGGGGGGSITPPPTEPPTPTNPPHTHTYTEKVVPATCETAGYVEFTCSCGHSYREPKGDPLGHQWVEHGTKPTCTTAGDYYEECSRCYAKRNESSKDPLGHNMKEIGRTEATCLRPGVVTKACTRCKYTESENLAIIPHKWTTQTIVEATCTQGGREHDVCAMCRLTQNERTTNPTGHNWQKKTIGGSCETPAKEYDECSKCHAKTNEKVGQPLGHDMQEIERVTGTCQMEGYVATRCRRCGKTEQNTLGYAPHNTKTEVAKAATCTTDGMEKEICTTCGTTVNTRTIKALGHDMQHKEEANTCTNSGRAYDKCSRCGYITNETVAKPLGHDFKEQNRVQSTCTKQGIVTSRCSRCGATTTDKLPLVPHAWKKVTVSAATCTSGGLTKEVCSMCNREQNPTASNPLGHTPVTRTEGATCEEAGIQYEECTRCHVRLSQQNIEALGHNMVVVQQSQSTCSTPGSIVKQCSRCNKRESEQLPLLEHNIVEKELRRATCELGGEYQDQCTMCGKAIGGKRTTPALGHNYEPKQIQANCTTDGKSYEKCSRCGKETAKVTTVPALGHSLVEDIGSATDRPAIDCATGGTIAYKCVRAGCSYRETKTIKPGSHEFGETTTVTATCTTGGWTERTCNKCGYIEKSNVTAALGHSLQVVSETKPTHDRPGSKVMRCSRPNCNYEETQTIPALKDQAAYAFFSSDDNSFNFVRAQSLNVGDRNNNKTVTAVYRVDESTPTGEPNTWGLQDWANKSVLRPVDHIYYYDDIYPINAGGWYVDMKATAQVHNPEKLHTEKTRSMNSMFLRCNAKSIQTLISKLNTQNVESMSRMFEGIVQNIDVSVLKTNNVTDMSHMFAYSKEVTGLKSFDTTSVLTMENMFDHTTATTLDLSSFVSRKDTHGVSRLNGLKMFHYAKKLRTIYATDDLTFEGSTSKSMFFNCKSIVGGNGKTYQSGSQLWARIDRPDQPGYFTDASNVPPQKTEAYGLLLNDNSLHFVRSATPYKVGDQFAAYGTIKEVYANLELPFNPQWAGRLPGWIDVTNKTTNKAQSIVFHDVVKPAQMRGWFMNYQGTTIQGLEKLDTSNAVVMVQLFEGANKLTNLDLSHFRTSSVIDMSSMFKSASSIKNLNISSFDTSKATTMGFMFYGMTNVQSLDVSKFNTSKVQDMQGMFWGCESIRNINVSSFDTTQVKDFSGMFGGVTLNQTLDLSNFNTSNAIYMGKNVYKIDSKELKRDLIRY